MDITSEIAALRAAMKASNICPETGLGTELFLFSSTLMPVVNVDLVVTNKNHEILLSWRDDPHAGTGWHIPGGCVRFRERLSDRVQKTAIAELGTEILFSADPIKVFEIFSDKYREGIAEQNERAHFITLVYACRLKCEESILEYQKDFYRGKPGYLKWFPELPENLLRVQECYRDSWGEIMGKLKR